MLVTFTNATTAPNEEELFLSQLYRSLKAGDTVTTSRTLEGLRSDQELKKLVVAGKITLTFATEAGDDAGFGGGHVIGSFTTASRPAANTVPEFSSIWNTDDDALNWSDGTNWRDATGTIT